MHLHGDDGEADVDSGRGEKPSGYVAATLDRGDPEIVAGLLREINPGATVTVDNSGTSPVFVVNGDRLPVDAGFPVMLANAVVNRRTREPIVPGDGDADEARPLGEAGKRVAVQRLTRDIKAQLGLPVERGDG